MSEWVETVPQEAGHYWWFDTANNQQYVIELINGSAAFCIPNAQPVRAKSIGGKWFSTPIPAPHSYRMDRYLHDEARLQSARDEIQQLQRGARIYAEALMSIVSAAKLAEQALDHVCGTADSGNQDPTYYEGKRFPCAGKGGRIGDTDYG